MNSQWTVGTLIAAAVLLLLASGRLDLVLIAAPLALLVSYLAVSSGRRKIWNRK